MPLNAPRPMRKSVQSAWRPSLYLPLQLQLDPLDKNRRPLYPYSARRARRAGLRLRWAPSKPARYPHRVRVQKDGRRNGDKRGRRGRAKLTSMESKIITALRRAVAWLRRNPKARADALELSAASLRLRADKREPKNKRAAIRLRHRASQLEMRARQLRGSA